MAKRSIEDGHLSKEEYNARQSSRSAASVGTFERTNEQRRTLRARRPEASGGNASPGSSAGQRNAFAGISMVAPSGASTPSFSFPSSVAGSNAAPAEEAYKEKYRGLNRSFLEAFEDVRRNNPNGDWSIHVNAYCGYLAEIQRGHCDSLGGGNTQQSSPKAPAPASTNAAPFFTTQPLATKPTPSPVSIGMTPAAPKEVAAIPQRTPAFSNRTTSPAATANNTADKNETPSDAAVAPSEGVDTDYDQRGEFQVAIFRKDEDKKLKKSAGGNMRLQKHKTDASINARMVMRDTTGKVIFNVQIPKGMLFIKSQNPTKNRAGAQSGAVFFKGVQDAARGPEEICLKLPFDKLDSLHEALTSLAQAK